MDYKINEALELAVAMANESHPHLVSELKNALHLYRKTALSFTGTELIPSECVKAYK